MNNESESIVVPVNNNFVRHFVLRPNWGHPPNGAINITKNNVVHIGPPQHRQLMRLYNAHLGALFAAIRLLRDPITLEARSPLIGLAKQVSQKRCLIGALVN